jgi:hypothetical protein
MPDNRNVVPFGKYKGQPVEVLQADRGYVEWLLSQGWVRDRFAAFHTLIVNNFAEPSETPEHNALQVRFLDDAFCRSLLVATGWPPLTASREFIQQQMSENHYGIIAIRQKAVEEKQKLVEQNLSSIARAQESLAACKAWRPGQPVPGFHENYMPKNPALSQIRVKRTISLLENSQRGDADRLAQSKADLASARLALQETEAYALHPDQTMEFAIVTRGFEDGGWDVRFRAQAINKPAEVHAEVVLAIEIKPSLGDDYPAVLRQMKANRGSLPASGPETPANLARVVLVFDQFAASGATLEQVRGIFAASRFKMVSIAEIEAASQ